MYQEDWILLRIGIVGTGIAGLTAGWLFERSGASVTLLERHSTLGMDAHSINVEFGDEGKNPYPIRVDVPPRMFNRSQWPNLFRLYREIGVEIDSIEPSKSFCILDRPAHLKLGASYQPKFSFGSILRRSTRQIFKDIRRLMTAAPKFIESPEELTLKEYLAKNNYSAAFTDDFLYPALSSTVCSCSYTSLDAYPASVLLKTLLNLIQPEGLFRTRFGTRDVVNRLVAKIPDRRLETAVISARQNGATVEVRTDADRFEFDHLIVATQANAAMRMIENLSVIERQTLASFTDEEIAVVVHTDQTLMPSNRNDWSHFNLISNSEKTAAMCSIWMNRFYPESKLDTPVFQTMMPIQDPQPDSLIHETVMQRSILNRTSIKALDALDAIHRQPDRRIWYCGSYASAGTPLLESGVVSSLKIAAKLGARQADSSLA